MAKLFSLILGVFLLFIVSISASTDQENTRVSTFSELASATTSDISCADGDEYSETTIISSDCNDCTNWCKEECADLGGIVVDSKCSIGESKFARRCKCCCRESPPPCPAKTCPKEMSVVLKPGQKACKYILSSSLSSSAVK
ncbi:hypothetical protein MKW98_014715 [Papaver atlanticum]|uniref:Uncharacterized protein n=1 Tax=Papaver atlanticum TaxID=357466 RepID=A0AAD4XEI9_9MAGN|nr:hypothetical protein MKW98_014715 [Papaver atlanticum]